MSLAPRIMLIAAVMVPYAALSVWIVRQFLRDWDRERRDEMAYREASRSDRLDGTTQAGESPRIWVDEAGNLTEDQWNKLYEDGLRRQLDQQGNWRPLP